MASTIRLRSKTLFATLLCVLNSASSAWQEPSQYDRAQTSFGSNSHSDRRRRLMDAAVYNNSAAARLRSDLLSNYDKGSYPWTSLWNETEANDTDTLQRGLDVELGVNFHKVFSIDVTNSVVDLIVWVRQQWKDPRLAWDPEEYGGLESAWFWIGDGTGPGGETSDIWTPDLELWNMKDSLAASLTDTQAVVSPDGTVFWSRPGHVRPVCKLRGLNSFPFDRLECTLEIGSWTYSGKYVRPTLLNENGFTLGGSETAGEAFAEYTLVEVESEQHIYPPFPVSPSEDWPVIFYHVAFDRAWQPYVRGYLVLQVVLNLAAFSCFWLPPHIGERMSLSITALLAAVASELVVSANLPAAGDATWFSKFSVASLMFAALALFESAAVIFFYYNTSDKMTPLWVSWFIRLWQGEEEDNHKDTVIDRSAEYVVGEECTEQAEASASHTQCYQDDQCDSPSTFAKSPKGTSSCTEQPGASQRQASHHNVNTQQQDNNKTVVGRDADDFKDAREMENNRRWQKVSASIDNVARILFPASYVLFLAISFGAT